MIKHILILQILGLISLGKTYSQDCKKINYQFDFGTTLSIPYENTIEYSTNFDFHPQTNYNSEIGYFLEFLVSCNLNNKYGISTGVNYSYSSLGIIDKIGRFENKGSLSASYVNIPVLFNYRITDKIPISISAGPYIGFIIDAVEKGTSYIDTTGIITMEPEIFETKYNYDTNIKEDYTSIDYGLLLQLDYEVNLTKGLNGVILTRFNYGLKNVLTNDLSNKSSAHEWKNYSIQIGLGLKL
ncbi:porin family protein [Carboxylicivirga linearis]|uniref:PorT family protein n=1 Tax=Carboxylicivirga linearis TaxID=1628157 RepID=A0ABS5K1I2_9BACT|nr:porin family protein [Carboxylicivirga linearis]MBS2101027.1 PorT family protein [Carboxylicivirga linearis]